MSLFDRVHVGPLLFFAIVALPAFCVFLHGSASALYATIQPWQLAYVDSDVVNFICLTAEELSVPSLFRGLSRNRSRLVFDWLFIGMFVGTAGILLLLQESLAKCRVRSAQVLRVMAYSALPGAALSAAWVYVLLAIYAWFAFTFADATIRRPSIWVTIALFPAASLPFGVLIGDALRRYLRLPRAYVIGVVASFTGLLAAIAIPAGISQLLR